MLAHNFQIYARIFTFFESRPRTTDLLKSFGSLFWDSAHCSAQLASVPHELGQDVRLLGGKPLHHVAHPVPEAAAAGRRRGPVAVRGGPHALLGPCDAERTARGKLWKHRSVTLRCAIGACGVVVSREWGLGRAYCSQNEQDILFGRKWLLGAKVN